jgi:hypothetical protein
MVHDDLVDRSEPLGSGQTLIDVVDAASHSPDAVVDRLEQRTQWPPLGRDAGDAANEGAEQKALQIPSAIREHRRRIPVLRNEDRLGEAEQAARQCAPPELVPVLLRAAGADDGKDEQPPDEENAAAEQIRIHREIDFHGAPRGAPF